LIGKKALDDVIRALKSFDGPR